MGAFFEPHTMYVKLLLLLIVFDTISGVALACINGRLSSKSFYGNLGKGLMRKLLMLLLMLVVFYMANIAQFTELVPVVLIFYISGEFISIFENLAACGVPFPKFLKDMFNTLHDNSNNGTNDINKKDD